MSSIYLDDADRKKLVKFWINATLYVLHGGFIILLIGNIWADSEILSAMFTTVNTGIGLTILILLVDKAADALLTKFAGSAATAVTETVTRTVTPASPESVKDVNIKAEGDVNVSS